MSLTLNKINPCWRKGSVGVDCVIVYFLLDETTDRQLIRIWKNRSTLSISNFVILKVQVPSDSQSLYGNTVRSGKQRGGVWISVSEFVWRKEQEGEITCTLEPPRRGHRLPQMTSHQLIHLDFNAADTCSERLSCFHGNQGKASLSTYFRNLIKSGSRTAAVFSTHCSDSHALILWCSGDFGHFLGQTVENV